MIRRLLLVLLTLALAAPAVAMPLHCEEMPAMGDGDMLAMGAMAAMPGDQPGHPAKSAPPSHDCIGCIAPLAGLPGPLAAERPAPLLNGVPLADGPALPARVPDPPPPRV